MKIFTSYVCAVVLLAVSVFSAKLSAEDLIAEIEALAIKECKYIYTVYICSIFNTGNSN